MFRTAAGRRRTTAPVLALACLAALLPVRGATAAVPGAGPSTAHLRAAVSPTPRSIRATGQRIRVAGTVRLVRGRHADPAAVREVAATLRAAGARRVASTGAGALRVSIGEPAGTRLPAGGYRLTSGPDGGHWNLALTGDPDGQYHAAQTLRQLIRPVRGPDVLPGVRVRDRPGLATRGIVEGYYGTPWSQADRLRALDFAGRHKLDTYVYAPKDDPYHRDRWREPYPPGAMDDFRELAARAARRHVDLVYALSPGTDVCYSGDADFARLTAKEQAVYDAGVRSFALFFDDIAATLSCDADVRRFGDDASPAAAAQAYLLDRFRTDFLATHPGTAPLLTVPTEYNGTDPTAYKRRFAALVPDSVRVLWTGPRVISPTVTDDDLSAAARLYRHPLMLWDNYPVNDSQTDRLYLGPLRGRGPHPARGGSVGLLANPMIQAEPSMVALATIADYAWNPAAYDPRRSWRHALRSLGGDAAGPLAAFADVNRSSPLDPTAAPVLSARIAAFERALAAGYPDRAAGPLVRQFTRLAVARDAIARSGGELDGRAFRAEADPWLRKAHSAGVAGAAIVRSLTAEHDGHPTTAWRQRAVFDRAMAAAASSPVTIAPGVLDEFLTRARSASGVVALAAPKPGDTLTPGSDVTLSATVRSGSVPVRSVRFVVGGTVVGTATSAPYRVVWRDVPRRLARTTVEVTDATGAVVRSAPVDLTIGRPDRALLVYGSDGNPGTGGLAPGERDLRDRLERLGLAVDPVPATRVTTADADGEALVMVSSTVASGDVATKFRDVPVPVLTWEAYILDDLGMATSAGEVFRVRTVRFVPSTPLSAGLSGDVDVYRADGRLRWAVPLPGATVAAMMPGEPDHAALFGYEKGDPLAGGRTAPARRVALYLGDEGLLSGLVTDATLRTFDTAVRWSLAR